MKTSIRYFLSVILILTIPKICKADSLSVAPGVGLHSVNPGRLSFDPDKTRQTLTISNASKEEMYFIFGVSQKLKDGKTVDITDKKYFYAVPNKLALKPGETKVANIFIKDIKSVPEGKYVIHYTPKAKPMKVKVSKEDRSSHFACNLVFRYGIETTVKKK